jgi:hemoglobin
MSLTEPEIAALVRRFYATARQDPVLGPVFDRAVDDWDAHVAKVAAFWSSALLGVRGYRGNPLAEHAKHELDPAMFERWLAIWGATAEAMFEPEAADLLKVRAAMIARSLQLGLFGVPGLTPGSTPPATV